jgi:hypothetical protein
MSKLRQREGERSAFSVRRRSFVPPIRDVGLERGDRRPPRWYRGAWTRYVGAACGSLTVSPWKCARLLKALNPNHRQIVEAALIRAEAIGRTEPHPEIAMKYQAERFPTVVTSHGFNMRQTSFLALHLRSPFPRLRKTNAKTFGGFPTNPALLGFTDTAPLTSGAFLFGASSLPTYGLAMPTYVLESTGKPSSPMVRFGLPDSDSPS